MFLERVLSLISQKGISKNKMLTDLKLGKNSFVNWQERGTIPSGETLSKIAEYFNVSIDYLLGNETKNETAIDDNDIKFALFSGHDEITDEMFDEVRNFAKFVAEREREKKKNESK